MSFHLVFLILFLFCSTIATKYAYTFSKGCTQPVISYITLGRKWGGQSLQVQVFTLFKNSFFILLYYSYKTGLEIFERLYSAIQMCPAIQTMQLHCLHLGMLYSLFITLLTFLLFF